MHCWRTVAFARASAPGLAFPRSREAHAREFGRAHSRARVFIADYRAFGGGLCPENSQRPRGTGPTPAQSASAAASFAWRPPVLCSLSAAVLLAEPLLSSLPSFFGLLRTRATSCALDRPLAAVVAVLLYQHRRVLVVPSSCVRACISLSLSFSAVVVSIASREFTLHPPATDPASPTPRMGRPRKSDEEKRATKAAYNRRYYIQAKSRIHALSAQVSELKSQLARTRPGDGMPVDAAPTTPPLPAASAHMLPLPPTLHAAIRPQDRLSLEVRCASSSSLSLSNVGCSCCSPTTAISCTSSSLTTRSLCV